MLSVSRVNSPPLGASSAPASSPRCSSALGGWTLERVRFGASDAEALRAGRSRAAAAIRRERRDAGAHAAARAASAARADSRRPARRRRGRARCSTRSTPRWPKTDGRTGITVYDATGTPLAWAGRVSELPRSLDGPGRCSWSPPARSGRGSSASSRLSTTDRRPAPASPPSSSSRRSDPVDRGDRPLSRHARPVAPRSLPVHAARAERDASDAVSPARFAISVARPAARWSTRRSRRPTSPTARARWRDAHARRGPRSCSR